MAIEERIWSYGLPVAKTAKVLTKGIFPPRASPAAVLSMFCSAIPIWKYRSGKAFWNKQLIVLFPRSASIATTFLFFSPNSTKASP